MKSILVKSLEYMKRGPKTLGIVLLSLLTTLPAVGQKDKNYYIQVIRLTDGTEVRLLPDDIKRMGIIRPDDYEKMTLGEYLRYSEVGDTAFKYVNDSLDNENFISNIWLPTNEAWDAAAKAMQPYYVHAMNNVALDIEGMSRAGNEPIYSIVSEGKDGEQRKLANLCLRTSTPDAVVTQQELMNGTVTVVSNVPRDYWFHELVMNNWTGILNDGSMKIFPTLANNPFTSTTSSGVQYITIPPGGDRAKPDVFIRLPKTLSTKYDFYCVLVPENNSVISENSTFETRPNWLNFQLYYGDASGNLNAYIFSSDGSEHATKANATTAFTNNTAVIDTLYLGRFTFPVAYDVFNDKKMSPVMRISSPISVFNSTQLATYTRTLRLAAIIMRPVEVQSENNQ